MENISHNKIDYLKQMNISVDVQKSKDVLGKDTVKAKDILLSEKKDSMIKKMSDVFPQTNNSNEVLS